VTPATLSERWIAAANAALELSTPSEIVAHIRTADAPDDGLRAASHEARVRIGHLADSHPERMALDPRHAPAIRDSWKRDDEITVAREGLRFIDAVSAINAARNHGTADTWDEAVKDAHLMAELHGGEFAASTIDTTEDDTPFRDTIRSIDRLTKLAHRWGCPHIATIQERLRHPDVCLSHARIDVERPVCGRLVVCKMCRDLLADWCDPLANHRDPQAWPDNEMLAAHELGETVEYRRLRAVYLASHGVSPTRHRFRVL
jgi:hypothetical protein